MTKETFDIAVKIIESAIDMGLIHTESEILKLFAQVLTDLINLQKF